MASPPLNSSVSCMKRKKTYPFIPKSTALLERGDFWAILLKDGSFGAGCVVGSALAGGKVQSRIFIAGVVAWHGTSPPEAEQLFGRRVVEHAFAHIKAITESGGSILGRAHLQLRELPGEADSDSLSLPAWGFGFPKKLAEKYASSNS